MRLFGLDEDEKKGKSGRLRRWFGGGDAAVAPVDPAPPALREAEPRTEAEAPPPAPAPAPKRSWLQRLRLGLSRSSTNIARGVADIFTKRKLDAASLDDLEDVLIQA